MTTGPDKLTASKEIDKINYGRSFNVLENANASDYLQSFSYEEIIKRNFNKKDSELNQMSRDSKDKFFVMLSNIFQSVTTKGFTTYEIVEYISDSMKEISGKDKIIIKSVLSNTLAVFHKDYSTDPNINDEVAKLILYSKGSEVQNQFGTANGQKTDDYNTSKLINFDTDDKTKSKKTEKDKSIFSKLNTEHQSPRKDAPSLSVVMLNDRNLRCGTRNALEISSFFNLITTLEYAKAYPFFNATFILPNQSKQDVTNIFKTATLNQFMFGSRKEGTTSSYKDFEGAIVKDDDKIGVNTNLSVFMHPQTMVNMNEKTGHRDVYNSKDKRLRITSIHDKTRPFMTLKDFTIDVSPTKGLMSFKTGKISLVLHDRTRMADIAPFIKPDLFGAFGAEIAVEYGWIHNSGQEKDKNGNFINPIGAFLDSSRCIEKYIIVNSQFTIENNGQVNINLSIAMKGPVDVRQTEIFSDAEKLVQKNKFDSAYTRYSELIFELKKIIGGSASPFNFNTTVSNASNLFQGKTVQKRNVKSLKSAIRKIDSAISTFNKFALSDDKHIISSKNAAIPPAKINAMTPYFSGITISSNATFNNNNQIVVGENEAESVYSLLSSIKTQISRIRTILRGFVISIDSFEERIQNYTKSLIGGTESEMFNDKVFAKDNEALLPASYSHKNYITLGTFISSLVGTHMVSTEKYDEIQLIFHTVNEKSGLAGKNNLNIASLPIKKDFLEAFLRNLFEKNARLTLESLISQVIINFVLTKDNPYYGLSDIFSRKEFNSPVKESSPKRKRAVKDTPDERLNKIYYGDDKDSYEKNPQFIPPSVHLTFDTLTNPDNDSFERTICRITVYDRNDNPYQELSNIYNSNIKKDFNRINALSRLINKQKNIESKIKAYESTRPRTRRDRRSKKKNLTKLKKELAKHNKGSITDIQTKVLELTEGQDALFEQVTENGETFYRFREGVQFTDLKEKYKYIIPSATFATQNTALISASVATVNEAKLNTVYITRADRNKTSELNQNVLVDMPLRILPAQASVEMFGCPWVNFGQYIFLDFETGTTIDNTYAVTGIQHTITPGKFTTRLSLSYGDVYGKYEGFADTFSQAINKLPKTPDTKQEKTKKTQGKKKQNEPQIAKMSTTKISDLEDKTTQITEMPTTQITDLEDKSTPLRNITEIQKIKLAKKNKKVRTITQNIFEFSIEDIFKINTPEIFVDFLRIFSISHEGNDILNANAIFNFIIGDKNKNSKLINKIIKNYNILNIIITKDKNAKNVSFKSKIVNKKNKIRTSNARFNSRQLKDNFKQILIDIICPTDIADFSITLDFVINAINNDFIKNKVKLNNERNYSRLEKIDEKGRLFNSYDSKNHIIKEKIRKTVYDDPENNLQDDDYYKYMFLIVEKYKNYENFSIKTRDFSSILNINLNYKESSNSFIFSYKLKQDIDNFGKLFVPRDISKSIELSKLINVPNSLYLKEFIQKKKDNNFLILLKDESGKKYFKLFDKQAKDTKFNEKEIFISYAKMYHLIYEQKFKMIYSQFEITKNQKDMQVYLEQNYMLIPEKPVDLKVKELSIFNVKGYSLNLIEINNIMKLQQSSRMVRNIIVRKSINKYEVNAAWKAIFSLGEEITTLENFFIIKIKEEDLSEVISAIVLKLSDRIYREKFKHILAALTTYSEIKLGKSYVLN